MTNTDRTTRLPATAIHPDAPDVILQTAGLIGPPLISATEGETTLEVRDVLDADGFHLIVVLSREDSDLVVGDVFEWWSDVPLEDDEDDDEGTYDWAVREAAGSLAGWLCGLQRP